VRVGSVQDVEIKLIHSRSIFGKISGVSGVTWEEKRGQGGE
jgi:hypothetical protein